MSEHHTILGGKVHVYKRPNSSSWQCATYLAGKNRRTTTKEDSLSKAKEFAEDWYLRLRGKLRDGELKTGKLFRDAAKLYLREFDIMTQGQRSSKYASGQHARADVHLVPFFGSMVLPEITAGKINEYRIHRLEEAKATRGKPPAHSTMHQEIVTLRQIFKTALRHGWIDHLPDMTAPYHEQKLANRELGTVEQIDKNGNLKLKMDSGREVEFNAKQHPHLDYGYAVTSHSSQGQTADRVLIHVDSAEAHGELLNSRMAYVSVSRAQYDVKMYTNDAKTLGQELSRDVTKATALQEGSASPGKDVSQSVKPQSVGAEISQGLGIR